MADGLCPSRQQSLDRVARRLAVLAKLASLPALDATVRLTAQVRDQDRQTMAGATVTWTSSSLAVAEVNSTGLVTAASNGETTITATSGSASGTAVVTVAQEMAAITVSPSTDTVMVADTVRLTAAAFDANGHRVEAAEFDLSSSDASVARVDGSGLVTGVAAGRATVTAAAGDATGTSEITVTGGGGGSGLMRLTNNPAVDATAGGWSPDGTRPPPTTKQNPDGPPTAPESPSITPMRGPTSG